MTTEDELVDQTWNGVVRWGGLSLFAAGGLLVVFIVMAFITQQTLPVPPEEMLDDPAVPTVLFALAAAGELLLMPGVLGLYFSLKRVDTTRMVMAAALWLVAVAMFLVSRGLIISLARISGSYQDATDPALKAAYLASAESAIEAQNIYAMMGLVLLSLASIIIGSVMLKGVFDRRLAYLVMAAGIVSLPASFEVVAGIPVVIAFVGLVLGAVWQLVVGAKLFSLGGGVTPSRRRVTPE